MRRCVLTTLILLAAIFALAQEIPLRQAWKLDWRGTYVRSTDGCVIALWEDTDAGDTDIWAQKLNPSGVPQWTEPRIIVSAPGVQEIAACVPTSDNNFVVLYEQSGRDIDQGVRVQKFSSNGQALWGENGVQISSGGGAFVETSLVPNTSGGVYAVYGRSYGFHDVIGQNLDSFGNQLWTAGGIVLASHANSINLDSAVSDGEGGLIVNVNKPQGSIRYTELTRFSPQGTVIGNNPMLPQSAFPGLRYSILRDASGEYVLWNVNTNANGGLILQRMDNSGNLLLPAPVTVSLSANTEGMNPPILKPVSEGGLMFGYEDTSGYLDVYLKVLRLDNSYAPVWGSAGVQIASSASSGWVFRNLQLAVTDGGAAWLSFVQNNAEDTAQELKTQYVSAAGNLPWGENGITLSAPNRDLTMPMPVAFSDRGMFLWRDQREMQNAIRRQVLSTGGATFQDLGGSPLVSRLNGFAGTIGVAALQDRYLVLFVDIRNGWFNTYYQLCDSDMNPLLEPNGRPLYQPSEMHLTDFRVFPLPDNSVAILYRAIDYGGQNLAYHLQKIDAQGNTLYPGYGVQITQNLYVESDIRISSSGEDIYIGWTQGSYPQEYLMGQRITNGQALWGPEGRVLIQMPDAVNITLVSIQDRFFTFNASDANTDAAHGCVLRIDANGDPEAGWPALGIEVVNADGYIHDYSPSTVRLGDDLVVFFITRPSYDIVLAQRITPAGTKLWTDSGIQMPFSNIQSLVKADDGLILLYSAQFEPQDLRLQKLGGNGNLLYGAEGHPVGAGMESLNDATLLRFANGSLACLWTDYRPGSDYDRDLYIRHINPQGIAMGSCPATLCGAWLEQDHIQADVIGNSALVAWNDARAGILDSEYYVSAIYATRVNSAWVEVSDPVAPALDQPALHQNYPNPFNPETTIAFSLPEAGIADLAVFNQKGQMVRSLVSGQLLPAGASSLVWDGRDDQGNPVSSGIYFSRLTCAGRSVSRKMVLIK